MPVRSDASGTFNRLTGSASPEAAALARRAQELGLPVRAAEISDSPLLRGADTALSKVPGMGYGGIDAAKQAALNGQIAGLMGENGTKITPALMQSAKTRLGQTFDRIEKNTWVRQDNEFAGDLQTIFRDASEALDANQLGKLQKVFRGIQGKFDPATSEMEGSAYQNLTRKGSPLDLMQGGDDSSLSHFAGRLKTALTGAFERSAPDDLAAELRQARNQYRVMKVVEPLVQDTGGSIDPAAFRAAVAKATDGMAYGRGGDLADLARVAQAFGPREGGGATASRDTLGMAAKIAALTGGAATTAAGLKSVAPALTAAAAGYAVPSLGSAAAGFAGGRIASQVLRSPALTNRLIDQALGTGQAGPVNRLLGAASRSAPETVAPLYLRVQPAANDDSKGNRLAEFLASRTPQRAGMLP
ncbi:hypothetical protein [Methylobacterium sp. J-067]|uniref:hypothetical protein n=1 Tax=Methylobacterium sp. J-067 TaxID=2836648 RepID=UPI001FBA4B9A|nr:hypothetical protein [Methylobacterium sp. J-067]MCJ2023105.1 hypothetical protein [Methylobacterium sp. J-067]